MSNKTKTESLFLENLGRPKPIKARTSQELNEFFIEETTKTVHGQEVKVKKYNTPRSLDANKTLRKLAEEYAKMDIDINEFLEN